MHETAVSELSDIGEAIDLAAKVDFSRLSRPELAEAVEAVQTLKSKLASVGAEVVGSGEATGHYVLDGHCSAEVALRHRCRLHGGEAHREIVMARALRSMPRTAGLFAEGSISESHVRRLIRASAKEQFAEAEELLCSHALQLSFADFDKAVTYWEHLVDSNGAEKKARKQAQDWRVYSSRTLSEMGRIDGWLDPIGFTTFDEALRSIEQELFEEDWQVARAEFGPSATVDQLGRDSAQRRATPWSRWPGGR